MEFVPEEFSCLKKRFHDAIKEPWNVCEHAPADIKKPVGVHVQPFFDERPGKNRDHVFDFDDGIRLIIHLDNSRETELVVFSGSYNPRLYKGRDSMKSMRLMVNKFCQLSDCPWMEIVFLGFTKDMKAPHWYIEKRKLGTGAIINYSLK